MSATDRVTVDVSCLDVNQARRVSAFLRDALATAGVRDVVIHPSLHNHWMNTSEMMETFEARIAAPVPVDLGKHLILARPACSL